MKALAVCLWASLLGIGTTTQASVAVPGGVKIGNVEAGAVVWFDLMVTNPQRSEAFYGDVFGWKFVVQSPEYTLIEAGGRSIGGLYHASEIGKHSGVSIYFPVTDLIVTLGRAEANGATVVLAPMPIPGGQGVMALFLDLDGNPVGLIQNEGN